MDSEIIRRWNSRVTKDDTVIHLGDFGFLRAEKNLKYYTSRLNGNIVHVKGNHDSNNSVKSIISSIVVNHGGIDWYCEHRPKIIYTYNLCGHVHEKWKVYKPGHNNMVILNVGVDQWDFYPINIQEILKAVHAAPLGYSLLEE